MKAKSIIRIKILFKPILFLVIFFISTSASAWNPPTASPTGNGVVPPLNLSNTFQEKFGILKTFGGIAVTSWIRITDGNQALDSVLASDALGFGNWKTLAELGVGSGGGDGDVNAGGTDNAGTPNYVTKWVGAPGTTTIDDSQIFDNGINVGVGTASPATKLDIAGTAKMTGFQLGNSTTAGYVLTALNTSGVGTWQAGGGEGGLSSGTNGDTIRYGVSGWEANDFLYNDGTKIGIGTTTPTQQLEITGNFKMPNSTGFHTLNGELVPDYTGFVLRPNTNEIQSGRFMHNLGGTHVGERAGRSNLGTQGGGDTSIGHYSMIWGSVGGDNTAFGHYALSSNFLESNNTSLGKSYVGSGSNNTNVGEDSLAFGFDEPCCQMLQDNNTAFGHKALNYDVEILNVPTERNNNTSVGALSMGTNKAGNTNTAFGYNAEINVNNLSMATVIGAGATVNVSNIMVFGKNATAGWGFGTQPGGDAIKVSNGARLTQNGIWTPASDRALKHNIEDISYGLEEVLALRPVEFNWNISGKKDIGFIAQEVQEIIPEVVRGVEGEMTLSYDQLTSVLGEAVKELKAKNDMLKSEMDYLELEAEKRNL